MQFAGAGDVGPLSLAYSPSESMVNAVTIQYAKALRDAGVLVDAGCPGYTATDLTGFRGTRTPEQGARPSPSGSPPRPSTARPAATSRTPASSRGDPFAAGPRGNSRRHRS